MKIRALLLTLVSTSALNAASLEVRAAFCSPKIAQAIKHNLEEQTDAPDFGAGYERLLAKGEIREFFRIDEQDLPLEVPWRTHPDGPPDKPKGSGWQGALEVEITGHDFRWDFQAQAPESGGTHFVQSCGSFWSYDSKWQLISECTIAGERMVTLMKFSSDGAQASERRSLLFEGFFSSDPADLAAGNLPAPRIAELVKSRLADENTMTFRTRTPPGQGSVHTQQHETESGTTPDAFIFISDAVMSRDGRLVDVRFTGEWNSKAKPKAKFAFTDAGTLNIGEWRVFPLAADSPDPKGCLFLRASLTAGPAVMPKRDPASPPAQPGAKYAAIYAPHPSAYRILCANPMPDPPGMPAPLLNLKDVLRKHGITEDGIAASPRAEAGEFLINGSAEVHERFLELLGDLRVED